MIYFMVKREFFLAGQRREITSGQDEATHLARLSSQSGKRIRFILPAREFSHIIESLKIETEPDIELTINLTH